jgi:hypothetical protein
MRPGELRFACDDLCAMHGRRRLPGYEVLMRALMLALALGGCGDKTGLLLDVTAHSGTSVQRGVAKLELLMAQPSWCDRWVEDKGASHTVVDVSGRDLTANPYTFLVEPVQATDIKAPVTALVLARDASGQVIGEAAFGQMMWGVGVVQRHRAAVDFLKRTGPSYVDDAGCACLPGQPWMGNGTQSGCDLNVITSFDRLQDTRQCELPAGAQALPQACDGQLYPGEAMERSMPCFAAANGTCRMGTRSCRDAGGFAYDEECVPADTDPALPDSTLCDAYLLCEKNPCGDLVGCFTQALPAQMHTCHLRIALTDDGIMHPCADGEWATTLLSTATSCTAALLNGTQQGVFTYGFRDANGAVQPVAGECPLTFAVDKIDASSYDDVPYFFETFGTVQNQLIRLHVNVDIGCLDGVPSLICQ